MRTSVEAGYTAAAATSAGPFVLNLCSSTTPMALAQTDLPELKRFTFFVSRRFEEGRERFRLHMGYFATLAEAEEWLSIVREIYPGAWAGEAPAYADELAVARLNVLERRGRWQEYLYLAEAESQTEAQEIAQK